MYQPRGQIQSFQPQTISFDTSILSAGRFIDILRQQWPVVVGSVVGVTALVIVYLLTTAPMFTASSRILLDTRQVQVLDKDAGAGNMLIDPGFIESQVQILTSDNLLQSVVRNMKLDEDSEFIGSDGGILAAFFRAFGFHSNGSPSKEQLQRNAAEAVQRNLKVERVGVSYALSVSFHSLNADKAARIANAISEAYIVAGLEAKYQSTKRAGEWLQSRSAELREQVTAADQAVQLFKAENNIVGTSRGLMTEQQLSDVNTQLVQARAITAEAKARLDRIEGITESDLTQPTVSDAINNTVIVRLRAQYLDLAAQHADIAGRWGATHQAAINLANRMNELRKSIADEVKRISDAYRSDYEIAKSREKSLEADLNSLVKQAGNTSQAEVKLRNLESTADTYRTTYNSFLEKLQQATQQQTFPITDARIISTAVKPEQKSSPKSVLLLVGGLLGGLCLGVGVAVSRELLNNKFKTPAEVEECLGTKCLGILPEVSSQRIGADFARKSLPLLSNKRLTTSYPEQASLARFVVDHPFSRYAETLRNIKVSIEVARLTRQMQVIGLVSSLPKEGKTTVSANFAHLTALTGRRTLLIDGDLHTRSLTRFLVPKAEAGLLQALANLSSLPRCIHRSEETGLDILPSVLQSRIPNSADVLASKRMMDLLDRLRDDYEYIIIDLAPLMPVTDAKAIGHLLDGVVYVIGWGDTTKSAVSESIASSDVIRDKIIGVILNRANPNMLKRIEAYKGANYTSYYGEQN